MQADDYEINSRFPMDKVVYLEEKTVTTDSAGMAKLTYAHNLADVPFCNAAISFDDWNTTYQAGTNRLARQVYSNEFNVYCDSTNITLDVFFSEHTNETAKIRVWGVYNSTSTAPATATRQLSSNRLVVNSRYNYFKLVRDGIIDVTTGTKEVAHNLGYMPLVELWSESAFDDLGFRVYNRPDSFDVNNDEGQAFTVTNNKLIFRDGGNILKVKKFYYRLYQDVS